jgi:hypothetical protein
MGIAKGLRATSDPNANSEYFLRACIKSRAINNWRKMKYAVTAATSSPDYSQQSAPNNRITSRSSGGKGREIAGDR